MKRAANLTNFGVEAISSVRLTAHGVGVNRSAIQEKVKTVDNRAEGGTFPIVTIPDVVDGTVEGVSTAYSLPSRTRLPAGTAQKPCTACLPIRNADKPFVRNSRSSSSMTVDRAIAGAGSEGSTSSYTTVISSSMVQSPSALYNLFPD